MDWVAIREKVIQAVNKYKYVLLVLGIGIFLMCLPERETAATEPETPAAAEETVPTVSEELERILAQIEGVGKVSVLLTEEAGAETIYQTDEDSTGSDSSNSIRVETVIISGSDRSESGLIRRVDPPTYRGAIVVCQGGDRPSVQLAVVEAVANVTGISADHITVLKMK